MGENEWVLNPQEFKLAFSAELDGTTLEPLEGKPIRLTTRIDRTPANAASYDRILVDAASLALAKR